MLHEAEYSLFFSAMAEGAKQIPEEKVDFDDGTSAGKKTILKNCFKILILNTQELERRC